MENSTKEIWKPIKLTSSSGLKKYAISSLGKTASYEKDINERFILKQYEQQGYLCTSLRINNKTTAYFIHKLLANAFIPKPSAKATIVMHLDYNKKNNAISNLKWATPKEVAAHTKNSPAVLKSTKHKIQTGSMAKKLDDKKVIALKKEIWNPKRKLTLSQIAAKYGIADMNLYRIKTGLLWSHIHIDGEPEWPKYKTYLKNVEYHKKKNEKEAAAKAKQVAKRQAQRKLWADNKKKKEADKKLRLAAALKRKQQKEKERVETDKRIAKRAKLAASKKALILKRNAKLKKQTKKAPLKTLKKRKR